MRNLLLALVVAMLPAPFSLAQQSGHEKPVKSITSGRLLPVKGADAGHACAAYGAGFVKIDGTETCVKVGGAVSIGVRGSTGSR
jgi:hypothetical protein